LADTQIRVFQGPASAIGAGISSGVGDPTWFAIYTISRHEKRVAQHFGSRRVECYLPLYSVRRRWKNGAHVDLELPLFPGYLFARVGRTERTRILEVPGVLSLVAGLDGKPAPFADTEIDKLRSDLHLRDPLPHPLLAIGRKVKIRSGPLAGIEGVIVRIKNQYRVVLTLDLIMQSVSIEVEQHELENVDSDTAHSLCASGF
jgi:transcription antitermination factor NusG